MPGPERPSIHRRPKPPRFIACRGHTQFSSAFPDAFLKQLPRTTKVRVLCTDPYATESSSDDEEQGEKIPAKKLVAEVFVPIDCFLPSPDPSSASSDSEGDLKEGDLKELQFCSLGHVPLQGAAAAARTQKFVGKRLMKTGKATHGRRKRSNESVSEKIKACSKSSPCKRMGTPTEMEGLRECLATCGISAGAHDREPKRLQCLQDAFLDSHHFLDINKPGGCGHGKCFTWHTVWSPDDSVSVSSSNGLAYVEMDIPQTCSDIRSPSSVLENPVLHDYAPPLRPVSDKAVAHVLTYGSAVSSLATSAGDSKLGVFDVEGRMAVSLKLDSIINASAMDATPLNEEYTTSLGDLAQIFDIEPFGIGEEKQSVQQLLDTVNGLFEDGGDFGDMEFELDSEALAWINVPETCGL